MGSEKCEIKAKFKTSSSNNMIHAASVIIEDALYFSAGKMVYSIDINTMKKNWGRTLIIKLLVNSRLFT